MDVILRIAVASIGIEPLKARYDVTKLNLTISLLFPLVNWHRFEHSIHISYIVHDMGALGVAQKIQIMGSLLVDKLSIAVHGFEQSSRYCSATPPNWRNDLSWSSIWIWASYVMHTRQDLWWITYNARLSIVMIH